MRAQVRTRQVYVCAILAIVPAVVGLGHAQSVASDLDATDRLVVASTIYSLVQQYFAHWEGAPRADVDAAYREYIDRVLRDKSRKEFDLATLRFLACLKNGRTQFFDYAMDGPSLEVSTPSSGKPMGGREQPG